MGVATKLTIAFSPFLLFSAYCFSATFCIAFLSAINFILFLRRRFFRPVKKTCNARDTFFRSRARFSALFCFVYQDGKHFRTLFSAENGFDHYKIRLFFRFRRDETHALHGKAVFA